MCGRAWSRASCRTCSRWRRSPRPAAASTRSAEPMMTRWLVPIDDTDTMFIELRHLSETEDNPPWWVDRSQMMPGQIAMESYEESQRHPGDYEAQVSQRPIAIHGLEHLSETDRGVSIFRNQVRRG